MANGPTPKKENKKGAADFIPIDQQELHEREEILKIKAAALKKEEVDIGVSQQPTEILYSLIGW